MGITIQVSFQARHFNSWLNWAWITHNLVTETRKDIERFRVRKNERAVTISAVKPLLILITSQLFEVSVRYCKFLKLQTNMSIDPPTYLSSVQNNIRARPIPWDGAVRTGIITDDDLKKIKAVDKVRKEQRRQTVESDIKAYQALILGGDESKSVLESAIKRPDVLQYMLVLTGDLLNGMTFIFGRDVVLTDHQSDVPDLSTLLTRHPDPYKPFIPLLNSSTNLEDPILLLTSSVLTTLLSTAQLQSSTPPPRTDEALSKLYKYLSTLTKTQDSGLQDIAVQEYSALLRTKKARELFWIQRDETVGPLVTILRAAAGAGKDSDSALWSGGASIRATPDTGLSSAVGLQLLYHVLLTLWQLSFEGTLVGKGLEEYC